MNHLMLPRLSRQAERDAALARIAAALDLPERNVPTDYTDPDTIDVWTVIGEITNGHKVRGHRWTMDLSWPNVTVLALANEILRSRRALSDPNPED